MATYRQIHTKIWADEKIEQLSPLSMLTFIYLFSNDHRNEAALYHITIKKISNETNQTQDQVRASLDELISQNLIKYDFDNNVVWVINALRYQSISPKGIIAIKKDIAGIRKSPLVEEFASYYIDLLGGIHTPSIPPRYSTDTQAGKGKGNYKYNNKDFLFKNLNNKIAAVVVNPINDTVTQESKSNNNNDNNDNSIILVNELQKAGILMPSPYQLEALQYWIDKGIEPSTMLYAIKKAAKANTPRVDYIEGILKRWYNAGIRTLEQAEAESAIYDQQKVHPKEIPKSQSKNNKTILKEWVESG